MADNNKSMMMIQDLIRLFWIVTPSVQFFFSTFCYYTYNNSFIVQVHEWVIKRYVDKKITREETENNSYNNNDVYPIKCPE